MSTVGLICCVLMSWKQHKIPKQSDARAHNVQMLKNKSTFSVSGYFINKCLANICFGSGTLWVHRNAGVNWKNWLPCSEGLPSTDIFRGKHILRAFL